jgi:hypothetical protein
MEINNNNDLLVMDHTVIHSSLNIILTEQMRFNWISDPPFPPYVHLLLP